MSTPVVPTVPPATYTPDVAAVSPVADASCVTCGAPSDTPYCATCGERRAADRPRTLAAVGEELWDAFSPVDGRIGRTLLSLVRRPGELTAAYMRGVRLPYVPPLRLFLLVNLLFFLHASVSWTGRLPLPGGRSVELTVGGNHTFDTRLEVHLRQTRHASIALPMVRTRLRARVAAEGSARGQALTRPQIDSLVAAYTKRFDANSTTQAKSLVIAMVPMFALLAALVGGRRRGLALHHVVFATHAMTFMLILIVAGWYVVRIPLAVGLDLTGARMPDGVDDLAFSTVLVLAFAVWLRAALRRAYDDGPLSAPVKAVALALGFGLVLFAYRALLFFTVFYTTA